MGIDNREKGKNKQTEVLSLIITKIIWAVSAAMFQRLTEPLNTGFPKDQQQYQIALTLEVQNNQCRSKPATMFCMQHLPYLSLQQTVLLLATNVPVLHKLLNQGIMTTQMQRSKDCLSCSETPNVSIQISPISSKILIKKGL